MAGLHQCVIQHRASTPKPVWNPDVAGGGYRAQWQPVPDNTVFDNGFKVQWEQFLRYVAGDGEHPMTFWPVPAACASRRPGSSRVPKAARSRSTNSPCNGRRRRSPDDRGELAAGRRNLAEAHTERIPDLAATERADHLQSRVRSWSCRLASVSAHRNGVGFGVAWRSYVDTRVTGRIWCVRWAPRCRGDARSGCPLPTASPTVQRSGRRTVVQQMWRIINLQHGRAVVPKSYIG